MSRKGQITVNWLDMVTHFFVQKSDDNTLSKAKYIPFDEKRFSFPLETVRARDWESQGGQHSGGYVLDELRRLFRGGSTWRSSAFTTWCRSSSPC